LTGARRKRSDATRLPSDREQALFEAGIKLGGLFHQFIGVPVSSATAPRLARAIEEAVSLQPFVRAVRVKLRPDRGGPHGTGRFGYHYLTAPMIHATIELRVGQATVVAELAFEEALRYPLMRVLARPNLRRAGPVR
jgi:dihydroneopterin aldolase